MPGPGWTFEVDDERLEEQGGGAWVWMPGFFAGEVTACLRRPDGTVESLFLLDVSPEPTKLGRDAFQQMLDQIWAGDPELLAGTEPATGRIGELGTARDPWLEFMRFRAHAPEFLSAITRVQERPRHDLRVRRESLPLHRVRRIDRQTVLAVARSSAAAVLAQESTEAVALSDDVRLDVPRVDETLDAAANRALLALALGLLRRATGLRQRLQGLVESEQQSDTRTSLSARWPARKQVLDEAVVSLKVVIRRSPLAAASRPEISAAGLNAVSADPIYARAWRSGWKALRPGMEGERTDQRLWISPSWEVFERWCFMRLCTLLRQEVPHWGWRRQAADVWVGSFDGREARLLLQPIFRSGGRESEGMWSVSRQREPDIVLTVKEPGGTRFVVLDAKYRASRANVLDAMESAHIYQDSLRIGVNRPEMSLLLVPAAGGAPWLENHEFQAQHRVGVHALAPRDGAALPSALTDVLA